MTNPEATNPQLWKPYRQLRRRHLKLRRKYARPRFNPDNLVSPDNLQAIRFSSCHPSSASKSKS